MGAVWGLKLQTEGAVVGLKLQTLVHQRCVKTQQLDVCVCTCPGRGEGGGQWWV